MPQASIRPGGKEEVRASTLKPYLLRIRSEKGEKEARVLLSSAEIDPALVDNDTAWISTNAAKKAFLAIAEALGGDEALASRGKWATQPEALGAHVRMLRVAKSVIDSYRYIAANAKESTRVADWDLEEGSSKDPTKQHVRMTYRFRADADDARQKKDTEALFCAARRGELSSFPTFWGFEEALIEHETCIGKGAEACIYDVRWSEEVVSPAFVPLLSIATAAAFGSVAVMLGTPLVGLLSGVAGGVLGGALGLTLRREKVSTKTRVFETHRIASLERGLELKGEAGSSGTEIVGTVLGGKYRIGKRIGSGGIGAVYSAEHTSLGHEVAVKVLRGAAARDGSEIARLRREAYIQVHIEHPNIARVFDLDQMPDGSIFVVMERLHGQSLAEKLGKVGLLTPADAVRIFADVCAALGSAHDKDVVHRDLKPGNIFLCEDGPSKVLDFGMSKLSSAESLTQDGFTLGTPEYMAPEQCIGGAIVPQTDLYSLGVVMYESLAGELPITSPNRRDLLDLHQRKVPMNLREKRPDLPIPRGLEDAVMICLRKRVSERPASAEELRTMLLAIPKSELVDEYPKSVKRRIGNAETSANAAKANADAKSNDVTKGSDLSKGDSTDTGVTVDAPKKSASEGVG